MTLHTQADRTLVRASGKSTRYVLLSFTAPEPLSPSTREPVNVAFVIDRSGSMGGDKIRLAREAVVQALRMLRATDRFAVVTYDNEISVVVPSTLAAHEAVQNAIAHVNRVQPRGNTNLGGGWLKGCEEIAQYLKPNQVSRCLLLTDGLANQGITDKAELAHHAEQLRARGVTTSTIGLGADFDEVMLETLSRAGGGNFYYVQQAVQISDCLTSELGEALEIVARDVAIAVRPDPGIGVTTLNRFRVHGQADGVVLQVGDVSARQEVAVVLKVTFPAGQEGQSARMVCSVADAAGVLGSPEADVIWTFAAHAANDAQRRNIVVDREVARLYAASAIAQALELNRAGRYPEATALLEATARKIESYAAADAELLRIIEDLRGRDVVYANAMSAAAMKLEHFQSVSASRMRAPDGKARRRP